MIPRFRAWLKGNKKMVDVDEIAFRTNWIHVFYELNYYWFKFDEAKLMQSTGLVDKNGKEIFEGDVLEIQGIKMIVKFGSYKYLETSKNNGHILGILHDGLGFYVECINATDPDNISPFEPETLKNSQIIGNVYENRELLEDKE